MKNMFIHWSISQIHWKLSIQDLYMVQLVFTISFHDLINDRELINVLERNVSAGRCSLNPTLELIGISSKPDEEGRARAITVFLYLSASKTGYCEWTEDKVD